MVVTVVSAMVRINMSSEEEGGFLFAGLFVTYFFWPVHFRLVGCKSESSR